MVDDAKQIILDLMKLKYESDQQQLANVINNVFDHILACQTENSNQRLSNIKTDHNTRQESRQNKIQNHSQLQED